MTRKKKSQQRTQVKPKAGFSYVKTYTYSSAITCRQSSLPEEVTFFFNDIVDYASNTREYFPVRARTSMFNAATEEEGEVTLIKLDGEDGAVITLLRTDPTVWSGHPSTLFYPGPSGEDLGFFFATNDFFEKYEITRSDYASGPDKWPRHLSDGKDLESLLEAVAESYPGLVREASDRLAPSVASRLAARFKWMRSK
jgi:hypothetical protein